MALFRFRWLHRLIRKKTNPIPVEKAALWKKRLSIGYMLLGWNIFGFAMYFVCTGKNDLSQYYGLKTEEEINKHPGVYYAELLGIKKAHVLTYRQFTKVGDFQYEEKAEEQKDNEKIIN